MLQFKVAGRRKIFIGGLLYPTSTVHLPAIWESRCLSGDGRELWDEKFFRQGHYRIKFIMRNGYVKISA